MTATVRIYRPAKTAMQSGQGRTRVWVMEFEAAAARGHDPLMGWVSSADTAAQIRLSFGTREEAIAYAERKGHRISFEAPHARSLKLKSYADNFRPDRPRDEPTN